MNSELREILESFNANCVETADALEMEGKQSAADAMRYSAALINKLLLALSAQDSAQDEIDLIAEARGPVEAMAAENMRAHLDSAQPKAEPIAQLVYFPASDDERMPHGPSWQLQKLAYSRLPQFTECRSVDLFLEAPTSALVKEQFNQAISLLKAADCPMNKNGCDGDGYPVQIGDDDWELEQCQWCDERKSLLRELGDSHV